jgi:DNA-binding beta-propeller fold protein YncE
MKSSLKISLGAALLAAALGAQNIPEIAYDSAPNLLKMPANLYLGEAAGVATNSKGNIFVFTRTGGMLAAVGGSRVFTRGGARLFEFAPNGTYIREIGQGLYGFLFAHVVRIDLQDNIWVVDEGSNMVIKFSPEGRVIMTMGRKSESVNVPAREGGEGEGGGRGRGGLPGAGIPGDNFNRPTDVAWDAAGNIFISDGYGNSRVAKYAKDGKFLRDWGKKGKGPSQFRIPHAVFLDADKRVVVADRENQRVQLFDRAGKFLEQWKDTGAPYGLYLHKDRVYLADGRTGSIRILDKQGKLLTRWETKGDTKDTPHWINVDSAGAVYVGFVTGNKVQKWVAK